MKLNELPPAGLSRVLRGALILGLAAGLSGCGAIALESMTGAVPSISNPFASKPPGEAMDVTMFVASTRPAARNNIRRAGEEGNAHFAMAMVSVPPGHQAGAVEQPSFGKAQAGKHFVVMLDRAISREEFGRSIATNLSGRVGSNRDVLVFVHGFNTGLEEARFRLAQIVADGRFGGVPVLFTWPTRGDITAYAADKDSATASRDALSRTLLELAGTPGVGRIHVLAHSMGGWLAMEGLREAAISGHPNLDGRLGEVMLAAPDIDLSVFRQQMAKLDGARVSVFTSANDRALSLSSFIARDRPRVGAMNPANANDRNALKRLGVTIYDVSGAQGGGFIGHDVYADAPSVIRVIGAQLGRSRADDSGVSSVLGSNDVRPHGPDISAEPLAPPQ